MNDLKIKLLNLFCASVNDILKDEADAAIADDGIARYKLVLII